MGYDGKYYGIGMTKEQKLADLRDRLSNLTILKDVLKGSVYYAVVRDEKRGAVFCVVGKTRVDDGYFMVKMMGDDEGPCYYDCPKSYIAMCTEPYNEYADEWRKKCLEKASKGVVPMTERKFQTGEQVLTLSEIKAKEGIWGDYLLRSRIVRGQDIGGGFVLNGHCYTRVF